MQVMRTMEDRMAERARQAITIQKMMLDLIEMSTFNAFDGVKVRNDLEEVREAWTACLMTRDGDCGIILRDLSSGCYNVDTLYILTDRKNYQKVLKKAQTWRADHILQIRSDGEFGASRWDSKDCDSFEFEKLKSKSDVSSILSSYPKGKDKRVIIRLWWD